MRLLTTSLVATLALSTVAAAQTDLSQKGRSIIAMGVGISGVREANVGPAQVSAQATGQLASLAFTHFVSPSLAFEIAGAFLDATASVSSTTESADAVSVLSFGLSASPTKLAISSSVRPFLSAAVGSYTRYRSETSGYASASASMQSHVGARFGAGVNFYVARHFAVQLEGDYHVVDRFEPVNGPVRDPSGMSLSAGLAFAWGGR